MNRFKEARMKSGLAQKDVANKLKVSIQSVSNWENDIRSPSRENVVKMSEMYGVSIDYLMGKDVETVQHVVAIKKEPANTGELDPRVAQVLSDFSEDELQRILDFASGIRSRRSTP